MQMLDPGFVLLSRSALAFSPDGRSLAVGTGGRFVVLDTQAGKATSRVTIADYFWWWTGIGFTAGGDLLAAPAGQLAAYDPASGEVRRRLGDMLVHAVAASPDGKVVRRGRTADGSSVVLRWDGAACTPLPGFGKHRGRLAVLAVSPDGTRAAGVSGKQVRVWNLAGGKPASRATCQIKTEGWAKSVSLSKGGALIAAATRNRVTVWDAKSGEEKFRHSKHKKAVRAVAISPARPLLVSGGGDELVFVCDAATGKELKRLEWKIGEIVGLVFAPDGLRCAAAGYGGKVVVWDVDG